MTLSCRGRVVFAVHANRQRLDRKNSDATAVIYVGANHESRAIGVHASIAAVVDRNLSSWRDCGYTKPDGGWGK